MCTRAAAIALLFLWGVTAQEIHLKTRTLRVGTAGSAARVPPAAVGATGGHLIVQFDHSPGVEDIEGLLRDGNAVVSVLPDNALVVASPSTGGSVARGGVQWVGTLDPVDKLSGELPAGDVLDDPVTAIVEFHGDVSKAVQESIGSAEGVPLLRPAPLMPQHAIVTTSRAALAALAAHDEVAYIFPADPELLTDSGFVGCAGMLTSSGPVAQFANIVHGWDLDSDRAAHLAYFFGSLTPKVPAPQVQSEIVRALNEWSKYANVIFAQGASASASRTVLVRFASGAHGDAYPFDGPGGILAHTFYPVPINTESIAGDMHLDADENWHAGSDLDIYSVALHEAGHAIGLGHSDKPGDVMYPYYRSHMAISVNDAGAARALYGPPASTVPVPVSVVPPVPATLRLSLDSLPVATSAPQVTLAGTVSGGTAPFSVQWQTDHGYSGKASIPNPDASNGVGWTAQGITLVTGVNTVSVTAFDAARNSATQTASVTLQPPAQIGGPANTPVSVQITSPASVVVTVNNPTVQLAGNAASEAGIARVTWQTSGGASGTAAGTGTWIASGIPLLIGTNTIVVRAWDTKGTAAWATLVAVRH